MSNNTNTNWSNSKEDRNVKLSKLSDSIGTGKYEYITVPKDVYSECENIINTAVVLAFDHKRLDTLQKSYKSDIDNMKESEHDISVKLAILLAQRDNPSSATDEAIQAINKEYGIFNKQFQQLKATHQTNIYKKIQDQKEVAKIQRDNNKKYYFSWFIDLGNNISNWWHNITIPSNTKKQEEKPVEKEIELRQTQNGLNPQTLTTEQIQKNIKYNDTLSDIENYIPNHNENAAPTKDNNTTQLKPSATPKRESPASNDEGQRLW